MRHLLKARINKNLLRYNLKQNRSLMIVYSILLFTIAPLTIIIGEFSYPNFGQESAILGPIYIIIAVTVILLFITPFVIFNYITTKRSVDVYHSLPIKRSDLFLTLSCTSLLIVLIPFLLNYALIYGLALTMVTGFNTDFYLTAVINLIYIIPTFMAIYTIPILVIANTGTLIDGLIHTGILTAFPFALYGTLTFFVSSFGFSLESVDSRVLNFLSPLYSLPYIFAKQEPGYLNRNFVTAYWVILFLIATCLSLHIFVTRKSEKSEEPFVNEWYFPLVAGAFTGLTIVLTNLIFRFSEGYTIKSFLDPRSLVFSIFISFVLYAVLNFFRYRSLRTIVKTVKQFSLILIISLALPITLIATDFMGMTWKVPKAKTVEKIEYSSNTFKYTLPIFSSVDFTDSSTLTDTESIQEFVDFHNLMNRRLKSQKFFLQGGTSEGLYNIPEIYDESYQPYEIVNFSFTYYLKDGDIIKRNVNIPYMLLLEIYPIMDNKDFIANSNPIFKAERIVNLDVFKNNLSDQLIIQDRSAFSEGLFKAYLSDIDTLTPEDLLYKSSDLKYIISYNAEVKVKPNRYSLDSTTQIPHFLNIDTRFTNTIRYLEAFDTTPNDLVRVYQGEIERHEVGPALYGVAMSHYSYYDENEYVSVNEVDPSLLDTMQGNALTRKKGKVLSIRIDELNIAIPIKP